MEIKYLQLLRVKNWPSSLSYKLFGGPHQILIIIDEPFTLCTSVFEPKLDVLLL